MMRDMIKRCQARDKREAQDKRHGMQSAVLSSVFTMFLFLSGCATVTNTYDQNGNISHAINCGGARGWGACYKAAGDLCGFKGYKVIEKSSETKAYNNGGFRIQNHDRSMMITCNK